MSAAASQLEPTFTVFISHAREDRPVVERIERSLTFGGRVRVRTGSMLSWGDHWREKLRKAIATSDVFIVVGSPASANSDLVLQQLGGAWALGKPIVVVTPEGQVAWAPPIEASAYRRVALADLEQPAFAEALLAEAGGSAPQPSGH